MRRAALLCAAVGAVQAGRCLVGDYVDKYTACTAQTATGEPDPFGHRDRTWVKGPHNCSGPENIESDGVGCACSIDEYEPIYGHCIRSHGHTPTRAILGYTPKGGKNACALDPDVLRQLCGGRLPEESGQVGICGETYCSCDEEDIGTAYTLCDDDTQTRRLVYFWVDTCIPDNSSVKLPDPVTVACEFACPDGTFLQPPDTCEPCKAGTFSVKGEVFGPPWTPETWPKGFQTQCTAHGTRNCEPWQPRGEYMDSGRQNGTDGISSTLTFHTVIRSVPALLEVEYKMESERSRDLFMIALNERRASAPMSGLILKWQKITVDLVQDRALCAMHLILLPEQADRKNTTVCGMRNHFEPYTTKVHFGPMLEGWRDVKLRIKGPQYQTSGCEPSHWDFSAPAIKGERWVGLVVVGRQCDGIDMVKAAQEKGAEAVILTHNNAERDGAPGHGLSTAGINVPVIFIDRLHAADSVRQIQHGGVVQGFLQRDTHELGEVEVKLRYLKDWSMSKRADRVFIRNIKVTGTELAAKQCSSCPRGHYSTSHASECMPCPVNTYAPNFTTPRCIPCPPHHVAAPGQTKCTLHPNCTEDDYIAKLGACTVSTAGRHQALTWYPEGCREGDTSVAPEAAEVECKCNPGSVLLTDGDKLVCKTCPAGHKANPNPTSTSQQSSCSPCPTGGAAVRELSYKDGFSAMGGVLPTEWGRFCGGDDIESLCWPFHSNFTAGGGWETWLV
eukprot:Hpha_TRINITY_DN16141_c1_g3::TRINITY_DN16141_c1_g3_i1::g.6014::m.6014